MAEIDEKKSNFLKPNLGFVKKPDLGTVKATIKKPLVSEILSNAYLGLLCWLVIFILGEIFISGGKSSQNPFFIVVMIIFLIAAQLLLIKQAKLRTLKATITSALSVSITIALLDYLIINLLFDKNNLVLYKYWPAYLIYAASLVLPFVRLYSSKLQSSNLKLLLTKKKHSL